MGGTRQAAVDRMRGWVVWLWVDRSSSCATDDRVIHKDVCRQQGVCQMGSGRLDKVVGGGAKVEEVAHR